MIDELYKRARQGDKKAMEDLVESLNPLVVSSIRKYYNRQEEYEDLVQDARLMIIESIWDFDEARGVPFLAYVKSQLRFLYLNKHKEKRVLLSLNEVLPHGENELMDNLVSQDRHIEDILIEAEDNKRLQESLKILSKREREIIILSVLESMTLDEIGAYLGISYRTVANLRSRALAKLRKKGTKISP